MANERFKNFLTEGIVAISHGNSLFDTFKGLFGSGRTSEQKVVDFGRKGWKDEHDMEEINAYLEKKHPGVLKDWLGLKTYLNEGHTGLRAKAADRADDQLRYFIASWDQPVETGESSRETIVKTKAGEDVKTKVVKKTYSGKTHKGAEFIVRVVKIIQAEPTLEQGYLQAIAYFDNGSKLPRPKLPGEAMPIIDFGDAIYNKITDDGSNVDPAEMALAGIIRLGQSSSARRARHQGRMERARSSVFRWPTIPFVFLFNLFS